MTTTGKCREPNLNNGDSNVCNQVALQLTVSFQKNGTKYSRMEQVKFVGDSL